MTLHISLFSQGGSKVLLVHLQLSRWTELLSRDYFPGRFPVDLANILAELLVIVLTINPGRLRRSHLGRVGDTMVERGGEGITLAPPTMKLMNSGES